MKPETDEKRKKLINADLEFFSCKAHIFGPKDDATAHKDGAGNSKIPFNGWKFFCFDLESIGTLRRL